MVVLISSSFYLCIFLKRYMDTTRMAGEVREYRDKDNKVVAFAHEVRKVQRRRIRKRELIGIGSKRHNHFSHISSVSNSFKCECSSF